jgi:AraC-like DNA-binding protein
MRKSKNKEFWIYYNSFGIGDGLCVEEFGRHVNAKGYTYEEQRANNIFQIVTKGVCKLTVKTGDKQTEYVLNAGDGFLVKSGTRHEYKSDEVEPCTRVWLAFTGTDVGNVFKMLDKDLECSVFNGVNVKEVENLFTQLEKNANSHGVSKFNVLSVAHRLFAIIAESVGETNGEQSEKISIDRNKDFVNTVVKYIDSHLKEGLSVSYLAKLFNYEKSYFYKLFKAHTGVSVQKFIINRRIHVARELCVETNIPFTKIAEDLGYNNYASFYKAFVKIVHSSPETYRKTYSKLKQ